MILRTLTMTNFRQFRGKHEIHFACDETSPGKNITVVYGENGRGKTGVFRAIMFCLFGERQLSQDGEPSGHELYLVNKDALCDVTQDGVKPVEAAVELRFAHKQQLYTLRRAILAMPRGKDVIEELAEVRLTIQGNDGNTRVITDLEDIKFHMQGILDYRVREYFLFDGERMERLTRASDEQRREVSRGIRNLLDIDALEVAIDAMKRVEHSLNKEIASKSTGEHAQVLKQLNENDEAQSLAQRRLEEIDKELELASKEKRDVDKKLDKYKEIGELLNERQQLELDEKSAEEDLDACLSEIRARTGKAATDLVETTVRGVFSAIDERKKKGDIPPEIRRDLIDRILGEGSCICGRRIEAGTPPHDCIVKWIEKSGDPGVSDLALELWRYLSTISTRFDDRRHATEALLQRYAEGKHERLRIQRRLEEVRNEIGTSAQQDVVNLEDHRKKIEERVISLVAEKQTLQKGLADLAAQAEQLMAKRRQLEQDTDLRNELISRSELAASTRAALQSVFDEFRVEIKKRLADRATALLGRLLDIEGRRNLRRIRVDDDYSLQILDRWEGQFLANISAGQRQIMSVSFVVALAEAAAAGKMLEMPLFMDTPFGRLSFEHRRNLISEIPQLCAQWILLSTDTELSEREGQLLVAGGKWGKFYLLKPSGDGGTAVEERPPAEAIAFFRSEREVA